MRVRSLVGLQLPDDLVQGIDGLAQLIGAFSSDCTHAGVAMWFRLLALALLLLPAPALADVKEKVATLAPSGLVLVVDGKGNGRWC